MGEEETVTAGEMVQSVGEGSVQATDEGSGTNDSEPVEPEAPPVRHILFGILPTHRISGGST